MISRLNELPQVHRLLELPALRSQPRALSADAAREAIAWARAGLLRGERCAHEQIVARALNTLSTLLSGRLRPVINATGVVLHTNLGRAPWSEAAVQAATRCAAYTNLEMQLDSGHRGGRTLGVERLLVALTGAEAAMVVNNGAAAVLLAVTALAQNKELIVSRGELVEIGGSFRVPEVIGAAGASQVEVGTTNRTHLRDYRAALSDRTAMVLRVHRSNFCMSGFVCEVERAELVSFARSCGLVYYEDLGSGQLRGGEHSVSALMQAGVDLVSFSGDKLIGGPQSGLIVGKKALIDALRSHPMYRALRLDKVMIAALEATLSQRARAEPSPVEQMLQLSLEALEARALRLKRALSQRGVVSLLVEEHGRVGGGASPNVSLESRVIRVSHERPSHVARALRVGDPAVVCRVHDGALLFDPRTVRLDELEILAERVAASLKGR